MVRISSSIFSCDFLMYRTWETGAGNAKIFHWWLVDDLEIEEFKFHHACLPKTALIEFFHEDMCCINFKDVCLKFFLGGIKFECLKFSLITNQDFYETFDIRCILRLLLNQWNTHTHAPQEDVDLIFYDFRLILIFAGPENYILWIGWLHWYNCSRQSQLMMIVCSSKVGSSFRCFLYFARKFIRKLTYFCHSF